jgi:hypothetical protein
MAEERGRDTARPTGERCYHTHYVHLPAASEGSREVVLREAIAEKKRRGWRLVSATKGPSGDGVLLVWETSA